MINPIMVGTIVVMVGRYLSMASMTACGSDIGGITVWAPIAGPPTTG
jgi:hypothetical protein